MKRNEFIKSTGILLFSNMIDLKSFGNAMNENSSTSRMPVLFIGHGNPMNALYDNPFTRSLNKLGKEIPKPKAILVISAHWLTRGTFVHSSPVPKTIHDFGGFPDELFKVQYNAPGSPEFAKQTKENIHSITVQLDTEWGLDHGAWTILKHLYPAADVPVFELSIDYNKPAQYHYDLAKELASLRTKGVLIIGSGNIVHNLGRVSWDDPNAKFDWSIEFDEKVKSFLVNHQHQQLIDYEKMGKAAVLSVPTNDHYLPMIYSIALQEKNESLVQTYESIEMGSISMRCFKIG
ncbi:MAG: 4,5-DOPA dioxygenase extradiol [Bacteroidia bacterium]